MELTDRVRVKEVNGFSIYFQALVEHSSISDSFDDSVQDIERLIKDVNNYDSVWFCAKVTAEKNGIELASDYLGGCYYDDYESFYIQYENDYFADMVSTVVNEAKEAIKGLIKA